jgi:hypothetical protein
MNGNVCSQVPCAVVYQSVSFVGPNENGLFGQIPNTVILFMEVHLSTLYPKKVKQSRYRPGVAQGVPGS